MNEPPRVDTTGLERAQVLVALVNHARPQGSGVLDNNANAQLTYDIAREMVEERRVHGNPNHPRFEEKRYHFDYVGGRPIKVNLGDENWFYADDYDQNCGGYGSAERVVTRLRLRILKQGG